MNEGNFNPSQAQAGKKKRKKNKKKKKGDAAMAEMMHHASAPGGGPLTHHNGGFDFKAIESSSKDHIAMETTPLKYKLGASL